MSSPKLVKDIYLGSGSSSPRVLGAFGSSLYFFANDNVHGYELWKTDGTESGTVMVKDINTGVGDSLDTSFWLNRDPNLESVGSTLYFGAKNDFGQIHLWKTDGTEAGTVRVKNFGTGTSPHNLTAVGNTLYFSFDDGTHSFELWKTDGTESGTLLVKDINQRPGHSTPSNLTVIGNTLYFTAYDGINGTEIWKTDGTDAGTVLVKDIYSGSGSSFPDSLTAVGNTLYLTANDGINGTELWKTDGTESGTIEVATYPINGSGYFPVMSQSELTSFGNALYFSGQSLYEGTELWKTDGTIYSRVKDIDTSYGHYYGSFPQSLTVVGNTLYFTAGTGYSYNTVNRELWKTDGTEAGTVLVKDIYPGSDGSNPSNLTGVGNTLYFTANDGTNGTELWKTDGTEAGTVLVQNLTAGNGNSVLSDMTAIGDTLYFTYNNGSNGIELWSLGPNNTPADIGITSSSFNENIAAGSTVSNLTTTDSDIGNSHTYTLVNGIGSTDNSAFTISGNSLKIKASPDYETKSSYSIRVQTDDGEGGTYQKAINLAVNDLNAPTGISLTASSFDENINANSTIAVLASTDADATDSHTYSLINGTGDTDNNAFIIDGSSLKIKASPDYETKSSYNIRLKTLDSGGKNFDNSFTLLVNNLNDSPTDIVLDSNQFNENINSYTTVSTLSTIDQDDSDSHIYSLVNGVGDSDNSFVKIDGNQLNIKASPNYETKSSYNIRLKTTDAAGESIEKAFTLSVNDLNDIPTAIALSSASFNENIAGGSTVATVSTTDPDSSDTHTYSLTTGTGSGDNASFSIDGNQLKIIASPDYEAKSSYNIRVKTLDNGGESYEKTFTFSVNDLNAPTSISLTASSFDENINANSTIAILTSTDADATDTHTFSFINGNGDTDNNAFIIDGSSLKIKASPDYETQSTYNIRLQSKDSGGETYEKGLILSVNDVIIDDPNDFKPTITGSAGDDTIQTTIGNDAIDGLGGTDTVTFSGKFSDYAFTRGTNTLEIADQRTTGTTDGTDTLKNIEYIQFSDQTVEASKVDVVKTYSGNYHEYKFYNRGNGKYEIKTDSGYDDITGYPLLRFSGEDTTSALRDVSAIADIKATFDQVTGLTDPSGEMFQLYNAAFKRFPDAEGLKYWINVYSSGINTKKVVAASFVRSAEFKSRYGENVTTEEYVTTLYRNVFDRLPDEDGFNYWVGSLNKEEQSRSDVLMNFAISDENDALFTEMTGLS
ncbi:ELWxxDGT repeat protein [Prochlorococcus marinus]|uniref:ELWxxDGT repeat protein n=1 Tax=Prochlorococcus marinus TaxID=1219 RepID=UPI0022B4D128|nr:ELWxxDGT repeat protein [Prochlorococcus marinus]